jgi:glutamate-ammonia-ligase adenylyltransferase
VSRDIGLATRLIQAGLLEVSAGIETIENSDLIKLDPELLCQALAKSANPDQALKYLSRMNLDLVKDLDLTAMIFGSSAAFAEHLILYPADLGVLHLDPPINAVSLKDQFLTSISEVDSTAALKRRYRRQVISLAARDLSSKSDFAHTSLELSWIADAVLETALEIAKAELPVEATHAMIAVIAMGKTGAQELNYISDVDVIFVAEPINGVSDEQAMSSATKICSTLMKICSEQTEDGTIWVVDAALRPEGKAGALVRPVASHVSYYQRWAQTWEFQALLKARAAAGDIELGERYCEAIQPFIWDASTRENFVDDTRRMRTRVESTIPDKVQGRELKLGKGGLRDIEFAIQLLQMVHGRSDESLRVPNTLQAISALAAGGYIGRVDATALVQAYTWLRTLEHRIQMQQMQRTHTLPTNEVELRSLGRSMEVLGEPAAGLNQAWEERAIQVRSLHQKLFYQPLLDAVAVLPTNSVRLDTKQALERLTALGYQDAAAALRHIESLTTGSQRRAAIQRTLLPVMLAWWADGPSPDVGLLAFRRLSEALGDTPWYLSSLRDDAQIAQRVATITSGSEFLVDLLLRAPESLALLADDEQLQPRDNAALQAEVDALIDRNIDDPVKSVGALRALRRRELVRTAAAVMLLNQPVDQTGKALTIVNSIVLDAALRVAVKSVEKQIGQSLPTKFAVMALGRFGGGELGFGSDLDVLFVHDPLPGVAETDATPAALAVATELRSLLMAPHPDPAIEIDADLRPEGKKGALVRSLDSYRAYYERWSITWESQALLRVEFGAGDPELMSRFIELVDLVRWPANGLSNEQIRDIRVLKARMESERLPKGADPSTHLKLGKGGLSDIEWAAQLMQLKFGYQHPKLRTTKTIEALQASAELKLISQADCNHLIEAWQNAANIRNALILALGKQQDQIPRDILELKKLSFVLGYPAGEPNLVVENYLKTARRAREVFERIFYDS